MSNPLILSVWVQISSIPGTSFADNGQAEKNDTWANWGFCPPALGAQN